MVSDGFIHACAGGAGGMIAMTATYPLVTVSTRAAVERKKEEKSAVQAAQKILAEEGVPGLFSGLSSSLIGISVSNFVYYGFFETTREVIISLKNKQAASNASDAASKIAAGGALSTAESMLAGVIAGSATTVASAPIWLVNVRSTVKVSGKGERKMSFLQTLSHIIQTEGLWSLWRGLGPALFLVSNPVIQFVTSERLKNLLVKSRLARGVSASLSDIDFFLIGALSKLVATGLTYPQVLIKSRQQAASGPASQRNFIQELLEILRTEGIAGLYRGAVPKLTQSVLTAAILFSSQARLFAAFSTLRNAPKAVTS